MKYKPINRLIFRNSQLEFLKNYGKINLKVIGSEYNN